MNDIDYQVLLSAYQKKVSELSNQVVIYEAKITSLSSLTSELTDKITKLESSKSRKKLEEPSDF
jgi:prefoldin subunit 5